MNTSSIHGALRPARFAIVASCILCVSGWPAGAATTIATDHHHAGGYQKTCTILPELHHHVDNVDANHSVVPPQA